LCSGNLAKLASNPRFPHIAREGTAIQKIIEISEGVNAYLALDKKDLPVPSGKELCPFCPVPHPLRRHGFYRRNAIGKDSVRSLFVRRLLCPPTGRTVSLLPDFLLPRKQHTTRVVAEFLHAFALLALTLTASMARATASYPSRQKGAFWLCLLLDNLPAFRTWLASSIPRRTAPSPSMGEPHSARAVLAPLLRLLADDVSGFHEAFRRHCRRMHAKTGSAPL
jgi:hypothetical protein